jgi:hypothetical protein
MACKVVSAVPSLVKADGFHDQALLTRQPEQWYIICRDSLKPDLTGVKSGIN